jgi:hypothetical protein
LEYLFTQQQTSLHFEKHTSLQQQAERQTFQLTHGATLQALNLSVPLDEALDRMGPTGSQDLDLLRVQKQSSSQFSFGSPPPPPSLPHPPLTGPNNELNAFINPHNEVIGANSTPWKGSPMPIVKTNQRNTPQCTICNKTFRDKYYLSRHMVVHSGFKPYSCSFCNLTFTQEGHLTRHIRLIHWDDIIFECSSCMHCFTHNAVGPYHKLFYSAYNFAQNAFLLKSPQFATQIQNFNKIIQSTPLPNPSNDSTNIIDANQNLDVLNGQFFQSLMKNAIISNIIAQKIDYNNAPRVLLQPDGVVKLTVVGLGSNVNLLPQFQIFTAKVKATMLIQKLQQGKDKERMCDRIGENDVEIDEFSPKDNNSSDMNNNNNNSSDMSNNNNNNNNMLSDSPNDQSNDGLNLNSINKDKMNQTNSITVFMSTLLSFCLRNAKTIPCPNCSVVTNNH